MKDEDFWGKVLTIVLKRTPLEKRETFGKKLRLLGKSTDFREK